MGVPLLAYPPSTGTHPLKPAAEQQRLTTVVRRRAAKPTAGRRAMRRAVWRAAGTGRSPALRSGPRERGLGGNSRNSYSRGRIAVATLAVQVSFSSD